MSKMLLSKTQWVSVIVIPFTVELFELFGVAFEFCSLIPRHHVGERQTRKGSEREADRPIDILKKLRRPPS